MLWLRVDHDVQAPHNHVLTRNMGNTSTGTLQIFRAWSFRENSYSPAKMKPKTRTKPFLESSWAAGISEPCFVFECLCGSCCLGWERCARVVLQRCTGLCTPTLLLLLLSITVTTITTTRIASTIISITAEP